MTERRFDPLRPVFIVLAVGCGLGLVALILLFSSRKTAGYRRKRRLTVLRGAVAKALQRSPRPEDLSNAA